MAFAVVTSVTNKCTK